jgi:rod shape-determining protein MreD
MRWFRFAALILVASILQTGPVGILSIVRPDIKPDLLLILLVFFAIRCNSTDAVLASFAIGFVADLSNSTVQLLGPRIISFGLFGMLLSDLSSTIFVRRVHHQALAIFLMGCLTAGLSGLLVLLRTQSITMNTAVFLWQPLYSAILGPFLFLPVGWWMHMVGKGKGRGLSLRRMLLRR